jgi:hypothetical protein
VLIWELERRGWDMYPPFSSSGNNFTQTSATFTPNPNDPNCQESLNKYDCINGSCVKSNVYGTPGQYATLTACQGNCGSSNNSCNPPFQCIDPTNFCPQGKVCVPQDEWSKIGSLVQQNVRKHCG